ncbi:MAG TPA: tetratricopeptide repeat protein, partial [Polyangiaceae bacterium]|nr:tetratricopeptide repeat protein [Polyangiaceae bacterium]
MNDLECRNELVPRERAGDLSSAERVALDAHLAQCGSCRLSRLLGRDFDAEATLEAGDGIRIAALSAAAERWARGSSAAVVTVPVKRRRTRIALLAMAAALAAVGASAAGGAWSKVFGDDEPKPIVASPVTTMTERLVRTVVRPMNATETATPEHADERSEPRLRAPSESAASLMKEASSARRSGDAERAIALYRRLESQFPTSPEASLATLPLGGLLLERGEARSALAQYDRHVRAGHGSRLLPEALYGRGRALAALGNRA